MDDKTEAVLPGRRQPVSEAPASKPAPVEAAMDADYKAALLLALDDPDVIEAIARRFAKMIDLRVEAVRSQSRMEEALKVNNIDHARARAAQK